MALTLAASEDTPRVPSRVAAAPVGSGISFRKLPSASHASVIACCDFWLGKAGGKYESPSSRHLFELAHEVKALVEPLRAEEHAMAARLRHLESLLVQWNEIFGAPGNGDLASPATLAAALRREKETNARMQAEVAEAQRAAGAAQRQCLEALRQHHRAHAEEREREAARHTAEISRLRDLHAAQLRAHGA